MWVKGQLAALTMEWSYGILCTSQEHSTDIKKVSSGMVERTGNQSALKISMI